jgi:cation diffusion facilitator CzcD-associated flavoprotein CzcO
MTQKTPAAPIRHVDVGVLGAGFAGVAMAARLASRGIRDFVIIERGNDVGGVWRDNTYPGAACDILSDLYSLSFAPNPDWSRSYGTQPEILEYLKRTARDLGLYDHTLFGHELEKAVWDATDRRWHVTTSQGELTARVLVSGHGPLINPVWPSIPGLDSFAGPRFHTAQWDHSVDLAGRRVAVIGTGASSIQVVPEVQKVAGHLTVFQRSAPWIVPRNDKPTSEFRRNTFRRFPALQRVARQLKFLRAEANFLGFRFKPVGAAAAQQSLSFLRKQVKDPVLRAKLTPEYRIGCKRILVTSAYFPALTQSNVTLEVSAIASVEAHAIVTADGARHEVDVIIGGTGFNATQPSVARLVHGVDGRTLSEVWTPHTAALRGTAMAGFPNLFLINGPNTILGHNSMIYIIESQVDYIIQALDAAAGGSIEATPTAQQAYNDSLQRTMADAVWMTGGCTSYYVDAAGRNTVIWPHSAMAFRSAVRKLDRREYEVSA